MTWFFLFFFMSGLCSLVYQVAWLRMAMAAFGVTTPLVSILLSVFMAGLALGSWGAGRLVRRILSGSPGTFLRLYALTELTIGVSGVLVPWLLWRGRDMMTSGAGSAWGSTGYYLASGAWITVVLLPFCTAMGATFPLAMAAIRVGFRERSGRSFSFLYVANVAGAMTGTLGSAFVALELLGFRRTMLVAAALNAVVATMALLLAGRLQPSTAAAETVPAEADVPAEAQPEGRTLLALLFSTGLASLAMEVVWSRQFVPFLGPFVYTFAAILAVYLAATLIGSSLYRSWARGRELARDPAFWRVLVVMAGASALLPFLVADPRLALSEGLLTGALRVMVGIGPFCALLGFLSPMVVDRVSGGDPGKAGFAYAVNAVGCIAGPLVAGFVLLPALGERWSLLLLAVPLMAFGLVPSVRERGKTVTRLLPWLAAAALASVLLVGLTRDFETRYPKRVVKRDHTATVVATNWKRKKRLFVNGVGITSLTPITKMMAHMPLAFMDRKPDKGLVLCLGMGTSFRSMLTWGIPTTAVELVPSVPSLLGFYHDDGEAIRRSPLARIVIDDARRFLDRTQETFDVIVVDPPPPVEAAASSLLYSSEFNRAAARRLAPGGIMQHWLPKGEPVVVSAVARALAANFAHVRVFKSVEGWGWHFLASASPIPERTADELAARMPPAAVSDIVEWGPCRTPREQFQKVMGQEIPLAKIINRAPDAPMLTDDRPINEYFLVRRFLK